MSGRGKRSPRCRRCRMHAGYCVCDVVPQLPPMTTRVEVLMHRREWPKTTATAHLARLVLQEHCRIHIRGRQDVPLDPKAILDPSGDGAAARQLLLLFPSEDAVVLSPEMVAADPRPVSLVVPDGNWRQASKVPKRERWLDGVPRVVLPGLKTRYRLREENREGGMATYEAIAYALGIIEGPEVRDPMLRLFEAMVEGTLATRNGLSGRL